MLKKIMIFAMFILLILGALLQNAYLEETFASLSSQVAAVEEAFTAGDHSAARSRMDELTASWDQAQAALSSLLQHEEIDNIKAEMLGLAALVDTDDRDDFFVTSARLQYYLEHIPNTDRICLENIL